MSYSVEMYSGAKLNIPSFIQTGSGVQKLLGGNTRTDTQITN
jgi:hypothetical protein